VDLAQNETPVVLRAADYSYGDLARRILPRSLVKEFVRAAALFGKAVAMYFLSLINQTTV